MEKLVNSIKNNLKGSKNLYMKKYNFSNEWTNELESIKQWQFYWQQQKLMEGNIDPNEKILEIGVGSGFTANYLKSKGYHVETVDIDAAKKPDFIMNIADADPTFFDYDVILAYNVFEHIPFDDFLKVMNDFNRSRVSKLFIGLPMFKKIIIEINFILPYLNPVHIKVFKSRRKLSTNHHHWELGYKSFNLKTLEKELNLRKFYLIEKKRYLHQQYLYFKKYI